MRIIAPIALAFIMGQAPAIAADVNPQTLESLAVPAASTPVSSSAMPRLTKGADEQLILSWLEIPSPPDSGAVSLVFSRLINEHWSRPRLIASGTNWFVNWADFPSVLALSDQHLAAHWLVRSGESTYAYDIVTSQSQDGGLTWQEARVVHRDNTQTEHGFATLFPAQAGPGLVWLDGRQTATGGPMTLRATNLPRERPAALSLLIDDAVCDCCQTDVATVANGPIVVYRNRTSDEIRDIYVSRLHNGSWLSPRPVFADNWRIAGCPVNGPAIAASDMDVVVVWFTMADDQPRVRLAYSADGGNTFQAPIMLDDNDPIGRVDVVLLEDGTAVVTWLRAVDNVTAEFVLHRVGLHKPIGKPMVIATVPNGRLAGFPKVERHGSQLIFAWTTQADGHRRVLSAALPIASLPLAAGPAHLYGNN